MTTRITRRDALKTGAAAAALGLVPGPLLAQEGPRLKLRLLETTDLHVNVFPYDYYRDKPDDTVGLAKTAALIKAARAEAKNTLLFDNGDLIQGSPLGDYMAYKKGMKAGDVHPIVAAMNELDYVCTTLGNHEFNYGLSYLGFSLATAKFPAVCANVLKPEGTTLVRPWLIVEREVTDEAGATHKLKIGVIGFVPPQIMQWDKAHLEGRVTTTDIVDAARRYLPELKAQRPDLVVALCHSGIAGGERKGGEENAALHLAQVPGIDVIMTGHQHRVFPGKDFEGIPGVDARRGTLHGVPAVMAGFWGSHLGVVDLDLEKTAAGWKVAGFKVEARPIYERKDRTIVPRVEAEAAVLATVRGDHEATLGYVRQPVGETKAPINSYFALVADDPSVQIVSQAQLWYVSTIAATMPELKDLPVLSAAAPFKSGGRGGPDYYTDIKPGPVAIKDVADIYLYPNTVRAVKVTGAEVREWLERSAGIFRRIDPGKTEEQPLVDPAFPAYNFDVIDGVSYRIDVTQPSRYDADGRLVAPEARRILDLTFRGQPIDDRQLFLVATNNYRAGGGGHFPGNDGRTIVIEAPDTNRDVIVRYIVEQKVINPSADGNWRFAPVPASANVTFLTSPNATRAIPAGVKATPAGDGPDGFLKFRLDLSA
ncbi:bifunctional 2',3'-cyclic-nucleotide 2'-phosphodiesterase/3'-nucleotidase [Chelatococcus sp. SYSU_G07232]|uniref:Bifunctional 2',3'-cyclic-nucleotide 2'-phosphodiesterase/3'-nucleotidase n=1 Tax=Chelatococcus albus TaxID=3047466 RepID=A0ABT7AHY4_9HYPH|nr:bifunctional 2',3'-cyclic-nucleotide 2'-phosphodiesterase/3'-nucleotidase [Chelatococcus sp. SYSU_G07232]MDJ1158973.1 bifunctional 2',3'-cyclic-nucleotide 2'-phosphodiesterase/3'-nucleotidase [Chelatococcus sp. SYSU_G07232]